MWTLYWTFRIAWWIIQGCLWLVYWIVFGFFAGIVLLFKLIDKATAAVNRHWEGRAARTKTVPTKSAPGPRDWTPPDDPI